MLETEEKSHFGKADFRARNATSLRTLPDTDTAVVKLTHEQQEMLTDAEPAIFGPVPGGGGGKAGRGRCCGGGRDDAEKRARDGLAKRRSRFAAKGVRDVSQPRGS